MEQKELECKSQRCRSPSPSGAGGDRALPRVPWATEQAGGRAWTGMEAWAPATSPR